MQVIHHAVNYFRDWQSTVDAELSLGSARVYHAADEARTRCLTNLLRRCTGFLKARAGHHLRF
jgi:hypothetical protein